MAGNDTESTLTGDKALAGMLALLVAEREERLGDEKDARKTESVLASAGLTANEIAALMGKKVDAVRKAIQRGRR
jgi:DNA-directed RNA polymerase specialized sigma24 family protein